jgi:ribosome maturation factor RimP
MNRDLRVAKIEQVIEPILADCDLEIIAIELNREAVGLVLRIFLDSRSGSIELDEIAKASRTISPLLDEADILEQKYMLEVSSPGIERPLSKPEHFKRFVGSKVIVKTAKPLRERKQFKGKLVKAGNNDFEIESDGDIYKITYDNVKRARLQVDIEF